MQSLAVTPELILTLGSVMMLVLILWIVRLELKLRTFMRGKNASSLEESISSILHTHSATENYKKASNDLFEVIDRRLTNAARGIGTVRFNALTGDTSGKQSFATAILSERGDGVVISSMHSRAGTRVYAKPVAGFVSEHELSDEERAAIAAAKTRCETC